MSTLRITGIIAGFVIFLFIINKFRRGQLNKSDVTIGGFIALSMLTISLNPDIVNFVTNLIAGKYKAINRLISILIISNLFLILLIFRLMLKSNVTENNVSKLVQSTAVWEFLNEYKDKDFKKKIMVLIPAYNEAENLKALLHRIPEKIVDFETEIVVVDDGSKDNTSQVAREMGAAVAVNKINRGGGAALRTGYELAVSKEAEIVVTLDADGQHLPEEIENLVLPILKNEADFISGSRIMGTQEKGSSIRQAGIFFFNHMVTFLLRRKITDCSNAFRALRVSEVKKLNFKQDQFHTTELIIDAVKKGIRFKEVPVTVLRRHSGETKKPRSLKYGWGFLKTIITTWWRE